MDRLDSDCAGYWPKTDRRWLRLAMLYASGTTGPIYLEDACDLADWRSLPTVTQTENGAIYHGSIPRKSEWVEDHRIGEMLMQANEAVLNSMWGS